MLATMILCAGLGTRLRPLSDWRAKPLVPVGDRPALGHIVDRIRAAGASRIVVNAHHREEDVRAFLPADVAFSFEPTLLGTAGAIHRAATLLGEGDIVIWNGDLLAEIDLLGLVRAHAEADGGRRDATLVAMPRERDAGNIGIDARGAVVRLRRETVLPGEVRSADFVPAHVMGARLRARCPESGDSIGDVYLPALHGGARIGVVDFDQPWWDIGTLASYLAANLGWLEASGRTAWSAPSAHVSRGVELRASIVGEGAVVEGEGTVERSVIWPFASASAPLKDAVVTPFGTVPVPPPPQGK